MSAQKNTLVVPLTFCALSFVLLVAPLEAQSREEGPRFA